MSRLGLRGRLTIVVSIGAALALAALAVGFNLALDSSLHHDADQVLLSRASAALDTLTVRHGQVHSAEAPDQGAVDAQVWIYSGRRVVEQPRGPAPVQRVARSLAGGPARFADESAADTRLYAVPVVRSGRRVGTVVAGLSLEPYERTASRALVASAIFAAAALLLIVAGSVWAVRRALRPVAQMTIEAATWSQRDLDHRFNAGEPHDELTRLAATFDRMLDRLAASLRREQRFSAELSHELRTPLSAISAEAELALARERRSDEYRRALEAIRARASQLEGTLETLLTAARAESSPSRGTADATDVAERARRSCAHAARQRGIEITVTPPRKPLWVGVDADAAERVLVPLLENACRYGRRSVRLTVNRGSNAIEFLVADDGPGVSQAERDRIFEPGVRGTAGGDGAAGAGLGLALARRLARALEGDVELVESADGAVFMAQMPFV
ncbi:MAG TPA: HAMP domain-containing sensor histidine kinase [Solirubrobacterales bacterium]|nr:HAMP domain-containing sensor histidine kinase [Solirubrobacterales bacterium]